jgi:hypothetical protein
MVVHAVGGQLTDLQEGRAGVQQPLDPVAGQQLAAGDVTLARLVGTATWSRSSATRALLCACRDLYLGLCGSTADVSFGMGQV